MTEQDVAAPDDLLYTAWAIIANARDWLLTDDQSQEWVDAAERWRDEWHKTLGPPEALQGDVERFYSNILIALGHASVCWDDDGVFLQDDVVKAARTLIDQLVEGGYVDKYYQKAPNGYDV